MTTRSAFRQARSVRPHRTGLLLLSLFLVAASLGGASVGARLGASRSSAVAGAKPSHAGRLEGRAGARLSAEYGKLPLAFEANEGQFAREVSFAARGDGYRVYLKPAEIVLALQSRAPRRTAAGGAGLEDEAAGRGAVVSIKLAGADRRAAAEGQEETPARVNYFIGDDPRRWRAGVHTFAKVRYRNAYPGVDVVYYGNQRQLEYDFVVAPGADPRRIRLSVEGASGLRADADGGLVLSTVAGDVRQPRPYAFQEVGGARREVSAGYRVRRNRVSLELGAYDRSLPLVIDPVLIYSSYLGGAGSDQGLGVAVDAAGSAYVCGVTSSADFPGPSPLQGAPGGGSDAFVLKLSLDGKSLVYATYLGGAGGDAANSVAVDAAGSAYVAGQTASGNFPTTVGAFQPARNGGADGFLVKLNPAGTGLVYATHLGGAGVEQILSVALDSAGAAYVAGRSDSHSFPQFPAQTRAGSPVQRSADGGATWAASAAGFAAGLVTDFAVAPSDPNVVYAGSNSGVYKSADGGASWQLTGAAQPSTAPPSAQAVAVDPSDPNVVYVAANGGGGLYKSTDGGATYQVKNSGISVPVVSAVAVNPSAPATLYAGTITGIFKSTDGADTWTALRGGAANTTQRVSRFAIDPSNAQTVYAATAGGVLKTTDGGAGWAAVNTGLVVGGFGAPAVVSLALDPSNPSTLYAGSANPGGLFKTANGGAGWVEVVNGLSQTANGFTATYGVNALLVDPSTPGAVYAGTSGGGVYKSADGGASWSAAGAGQTNGLVTALGARPGSPATILAGSNVGGDAFAAKFNASGSQVEYARFLGGSENDAALGVAVGADGSAYVAGTTTSADFPAANAFQPAGGGLWDAFAVKLSPSGATAYSTHLGGSSYDEGRGVAVGAGGEAYVVGVTYSNNFPVANAMQPGPGDLNGFGDSFVTRLAADGQSLVYSTYLGGSSYEQANAVAVGADGSAYVAGLTRSENFPVVNLSGARGSGRDVYVSRLNPAGSALLFSAAFGGNSDEQANAVAADARGNAYVVGVTTSTALPVVNALDGAYGGGGGDGFVFKIGPNADLSLANADSRDPVMVGNNLTYTLTVTNSGADAAEAVSLTDTLPPGVAFVSANASQGSCAGGATVTCALGTLAAGASATVGIVVTPQSVGELANAASVTSDTPDQDASDNSAEQKTRVSALPSIAGRVRRADGSGVGSVAVALSGSRAEGATTGGDGFYQFADLAQGGDYGVTPARQGWVFHPQGRSFANVTADQTADFTAVECLFQITPRNRSFPAAGGSGAVTINAPDALCPWTASSDAPWITVNSGPGGAGTAEVTFTVAPTALPRSGTLRIGGNVFTVWQEVSPCDAATFTTAPAYPAGPAPVDIEKGDFNNDGRPDLVVVNEQPSGGGHGRQLAVLLGTGAGGFEAPRTVAFGGQPRDVGVGDFNGDGKLDVVAAVFGQSNNVLVYLGDGAGGLSPLAVFTAGGLPASVAVSDFNADGKADLAVANENSNNVSILLGVGNGLFGAAQQITGPGTGLHSARRVVTGDFNKDGKQDLVVRGSFMWRIMGNGDGTFAPAVMFDTTQTLGSVVVGDFNRDGALDLAGTTIFNTVRVTFIPGDGAGGFGAPVHSPAGGREVGSLAVADFDGDGDPDLGAVNASSNDVNALLGDGAGGFTPGPAYAGRTGLRELVAGDFNGDGRPDLAVTESNLLLNGGGAVVTLAGTGSGGFVGARSFLVSPQSSLVEVAADDFNGDGVLDLLSFNTFSVTLLAGGAPGELGAPVTVATGDTPFTADFGARSVSTDDFNGDGRPDFAYLKYDSSNSKSHVKVFVNNGSGNFTLAGDTPINFNNAVLIRDLNGDRAPDIAFLEANNLVVRLGDGRGGFGASSVILAGVGTSLSTMRLESGDFDGDGRADLALSTAHSDPFSSSVRLRVMRGDGQGGFSEPALVPFAGFAATMQARDLNGDGRADLVTIAGAPRKLRVLLSNPAGGFTAGEDFAAGSDPSRFFIHDLNGDAKPDLVVSNNITTPSTNTVNVLKGDGAGGFSAPTPLVTLSAPAAAAFGDFDRDGHFDVALGRIFSNGVGLYLNACPDAQAATTVQFGAAAFSAGEGAGAAAVTVTRAGDASGASSVRYSTLDGAASSRSDYTTSVGVLRFAPGETSKTFQVLLTDDALVEGAESLTLVLSDPVGAGLGAPNSAPLAVADNDAAPGGPNPLDDAAFFVRQHYHDFLNREPDQSGLDHWTNEINQCGADAACREVKRINVSAAFFLSIEFQETGYLVYRTYKAAYGDATSPNVAGTVPVIRLNEFLPDTQQISQGVQVGIGNWGAQLEANKQAYAQEFVQRARFLAAFPLSMTAAQFVDRLNQNAGGVLSQAERDQLASQLASASDQGAGRAAALRQVAEHPSLKQRELNRAFVLMQFYGYLRRNPDDPQDTDFRGWRFWLSKLEEFNGNFVEAEMVKAFLNADEYRRRFAP